MIIGSLYVLKDKLTGRCGEIMHADNDAAIIRTFDKLFSSEKHNFMIRDLELFRFAELDPVDGDPFPVILNIDDPVCILSGADYYEESEECVSQ